MAIVRFPPCCAAAGAVLDEELVLLQAARLRVSVAPAVRNSVVFLMAVPFGRHGNTGSAGAALRSGNEEDGSHLSRLAPPGSPAFCGRLGQSNDPDESGFATSEPPRECAHANGFADESRYLAVEVLNDRNIVFEQDAVDDRLVLKREPVRGGDAHPG